MFVVMVAGRGGLATTGGLHGGGGLGGSAEKRTIRGLGDCSTIILISCVERLHAMLIASRGIFNKYLIRHSIITA